MKLVLWCTSILSDQSGSAGRFPNQVIGPLNCAQTLVDFATGLKRSFDRLPDFKIDLPKSSGRLSDWITGRTKPFDELPNPEIDHPVSLAGLADYKIDQPMSFTSLLRSRVNCCDSN